MLHVFIGYDPKEAIAFHACANSIIRHARQPVAIHPLALNSLTGYDETHKDGTNQFIYSRFLIPHLMGYEGIAVFIDGDMIVRSDIAELFDAHQPGNAVSVVKHDYKTKHSTKYLGQKNEDYPRKNWSSVVVWNCSHAENRCLTPDYVKQSTGAHLHRFNWLTDDQIGALPIQWNWMPDEFGPNQAAKLLHWTAGTPCFHDYATSPMADEWHRERILTNHSNQIGI